MNLRSLLAAAVLLSTSTLGCSSDSIKEGSGEAAVDESGTEDSGTEDSGTEDSCAVGAEGCPCTPGGSCDPGLTCEDGICEDNCAIGLEGCPCTEGGACDPGLVCDQGACLPASGDGDGDGGLVCDLPGNCSKADWQACYCADCYDANQCTGDEDCICPGCINADFCQNCNHDGECNPWFESCGCSDCAAHQECN